MLRGDLTVDEVGGADEHAGEAVGVADRDVTGAASVGSHTVLYLIARGVPGVLAFLAIPVFTRLLEPGEYALYALAMTSIGTANSLVFEWIRWSIVRCLPVDPGARRSFVSTVVTLWLGLAAAVVVVAASALAVPTVRPLAEVLVVAVAVLLAQSMFEIVTELLRADLRPWHFMVLHLIRAVAFVGLGYVLLRLGFGWTGPLIAVAVGMTIAGASAVRGRRLRARVRLDRGRAAEMFRYGAPISITVALAGLIFLTDRLLVALLLGNDAAGVYSVAFDFTTQTVTLVMVAVSMAAFPIAVRELETRGDDAARRPMATNAALLLAIGVPASIGVGVLAPGVAAVFFPPAYAGAAEIIPLVAAGALLAGLKAYHFDTALQFSRRTVQQVWIVLGALVLNILLNLLLIPVLELHGAALASVVTFLAVMLFTAWWGRRHFRLPFPFRDAAVVVLAGAVMAGALAPFRDGTGVAALAVQVLGGSVVYGAVLVLANFLGVRAALQGAVTRSGWSGPRARGEGAGRG